jgi:hypothetical protein
MFPLIRSVNGFGDNILGFEELNSIAQKGEDAGPLPGLSHHQHEI